MNESSECPDPADLADLLGDDLPAELRAELTAHLDECSSCRERLERAAGGNDSVLEMAPLLADGPPSDPRERAVLRKLRSRLGEEPSLDPEEVALRLEFLEPSSRPDSLGRLARYEVLEVVGCGGMGMVLKALDPELNRFVAIKVLLTPRLAGQVAARKRFAREARAAAAVSHEHVVPIFAVEESRGLPYLVMPLIAGTSLQARIDRDGTLGVAEILRIGSQAAAGLAAAHAQGIIHRDVKPSNILLENGVERVKLTDFGLACSLDDASLTETGILAGTPQYMSPEQARGEPIDHRTDLFSLGSVLYAMCVGRPPFRAPNALAVLRRVCDEQPRPIREVNPEIPPWFVEIVQKLMAKNPDDRHESAAAVAKLLESRLARLQASSDVAAFEEPSPDNRSRHRRWSAAAIAVLTLLAGLGWAEAADVIRVSDAVATILRIPTRQGTLVLQLDDPAVRVRVDGDTEEVRIEGAGVHEIRLRPGSHTITATRDGVPVYEQLLSISRGGKSVARIGRDTLPPPSTPQAASGLLPGRATPDTTAGISLPEAHRALLDEYERIKTGPLRGDREIVERLERRIKESTKLPAEGRAIPPSPAVDTREHRRPAGERSGAIQGSPRMTRGNHLRPRAATEDFGTLP